MSDQIDPVWQHGDNIYPGFKYKYYKKQWKGVVLHIARNTLHRVGEMRKVVAMFHRTLPIIFSGSLTKSMIKGKQE
jgi:ATP sulfurylase